MNWCTLTVLLKQQQYTVIILTPFPAL